ncbi:hypothetical protein [Rothia nasimurium]|uniref:hypothetical protein n=1 Tax=Rothia nasimurium TaxID=85336 RepID=UPI001F29D1D1|nr:hypothetical protein [Rothia nasimurium]
MPKKNSPNRLATPVHVVEEPTALSFTLTARARRIFLDAGAPADVMQALGLDDDALRADAVRLRNDRDGIEPTPKPIRWEAA